MFFGSSYKMMGAIQPLTAGEQPKPDTQPSGEVKWEIERYQLSACACMSLVTIRAPACFIQVAQTGFHPTLCSAREIHLLIALIRADSLSHVKSSC